MIGISVDSQEKKHTITAHVRGTVSLEIASGMLDIMDDPVLREEILLEAVHIGLREKFGQFDRFELTKSDVVANNKKAAGSTGSPPPSPQTSTPKQTACYNVAVDFDEFSTCVHNLQEEYDRVVGCARTANETVESIAEQLFVSTSDEGDNGQCTNISGAVDNIRDQVDLSSIRLLLNTLQAVLTSACSPPVIHPPHDAGGDLPSKGPSSLAAGRCPPEVAEGSVWSSNSSSDRASNGSHGAEASGYRLLKGDDDEEYEYGNGDDIGSDMPPVDGLYDDDTSADSHHDVAAGRGEGCEVSKE